MAFTILQGQNWNTAGNWSGASVPVDTNEALIPEALGAAVNAGLTQTGVELAKLIVAPMFAFPVGSSAGHLQINSDIVEYYGTGGFFYTARDDNATGETTDTVIIQAGNSNVPVELDTYATVSDSAYTTVRLMRGNVQILGGMAWQAAGAVEVGYVTNMASDVTCKIANGNTLPTLKQNGGLVMCDTLITAADVAGGRLIQDTAAITTLNVMAGGRCDYKSTATMTTANVYSGGYLDLTQKLGNTTITTLNLFSGGVVRYIPNQLTVTNFNRYDQVFEG